MCCFVPRCKELEKLSLTQSMDFTDYLLSATAVLFMTLLTLVFVSVFLMVTQGAVDNYFIPGGFALTHADNVTDVSAPEAYALSDLDEGQIKTALSNAQKTLSSEAEGSEGKQVAQIEVDTLSAMARALGMAGV